MEKVMDQEQGEYIRAKPEPRVRWSCMWPVRLVRAIQRYSVDSGIPQAVFVKRAVEKALREVGAL